MRQDGEASREEQAQAIGELAQRVAALEKAGNGAVQAQGGTPPTAAGGAGQPKTGAAANSVGERPRRVYPDLVTAEAEPGEELVYGDAATASIVRWREARDAVPRIRDALERLNVRERRMELEIELIAEHQLTLPPAASPWTWGDRDQEVRRRNDALNELMVDRRMLKLRRFLTLGLWRQ